MNLFGKDIPPAVTPAVTASEGVSREEFTALTKSIGSLVETVRESVNRPVVVQQAAAPVVVAPEPDISDEEIDAAVLEGKGSAKIKALIARGLNAARQEVSQEVAALRNYGAATMGSLSEKTFFLGLNADKREIYAQYEKQIRAAVESCDASLRGLPETWESAFKYVVGENYDALQGQRLEAELRRRAAEEDATRAALPGKGARPQSAVADEVPSFAELAGDDFMRKYPDMDEGEFLKRMNRGKAPGKKYKSWEDYNSRGKAVEAGLAAIAQGYDDGGEGALPSRLQ